MRIEPIKAQPSFGYSNILKTEWQKGRLKSVKYGFYGDLLTKETVSLEHLQPASKGGKTTLSNLVLASKNKNQLRGNADIRLFADKTTVLNYLMQFVGVKTKHFNGNSYIKSIIKTLQILGINL